MSDGSYSRFNFAFESTPGTTPTTIAAMYQFPLVRQSMRHQQPKAQSRIITPSRDIKSIVRLSTGAAGRIETEMMYPVTGDALLQAILASLCYETEAAQVSTTTCSIQQGAPTAITRTGAYDFAAAGWEAGDIALLSGAVDAADNKYVLVTAVALGTLTVEQPDGADWTQDNSGTITVKRGARSKNGTYRRYASCERLWTDLGKMIGWTGQVFNGMDVNAQIGQITTVGFDLVGFGGQSADMDDPSSPYQGFPGTITYVTETEVPVMEPTGIINVVVDGKSYACNSLNLRTNNNARVRSVFGQLGPDAIPVGQFGVSGAFGAYMAMLEPIQLLEDDETFAMWFIMEDGEGRSFGVSMGACKIDDIGVDTDGANSDEIAQANFSAQLSDWGETIRVFRFQ